MNTGFRAYGPMSPAGASQCMTCRSTTIGTSSPASCGAHAPGVSTSASASYVPAAVRTRAGGPACQDSTGPADRSSAPAAAASRSWAATVASGRAYPARRSTRPSSPGANRKVGNRRATAAASSTSCGRSHCSAERSEPPKVGPSGGPAYRPPVGTNRSEPLSATSRCHSSQARSSSGTYAGSSR